MLFVGDNNHFMKIEHGWGMGVDIEVVERFRKSGLAADELFLKKVFTAKELEYCLAKIDPAPHLAGRYAGKEAVLKALSAAGVKEMTVLSYIEIEILNDGLGVPIVIWQGAQRDQFEIRITIAHSDDNAVAFVIALPVSKK